MTALAQPQNSVKKSFSLGRFTLWVVMAVILFTTLFPFWWVIRTSLTAPDKVFTDPTSLMPVEPTLDNYKRVLGLVDSSASVAAGGSGQSINFFLFLRNSIIFAALITVGQVFFSSTAAYAFARLRFPFRDQLFLVYISALVVPPIVTLIPNFILIRNLEWINT
ncbi:MAG: carbohydrate ABC transporter permease, partial [Chloroflexi bacterium]